MQSARKAAEKTGRRSLFDGFSYDRTDPPLGVDEDHPCFATLEFQPTTTPRILLRGAPGILFEGGDEEMFVLHGISSDGVECSLLDCFAGNITGTFPRGQSSVELIGHLLVHGAHVRSEDELVFSRAELAITGLREMIWDPVAIAEHKLRNGLVGANDDGVLVMPLNGGTATLVPGELTETGKHTTRKERTATLRLHLDRPLPYREWLDHWVQPTLNLVRFATGRPAQLSSLVAVWCESDAGNAVWPDATERRDVEFCEARASLLRDDSDGRYRGVLFGTGAFDDGFGPCMNRWFVLSRELGGIVGLLFAVMQSHGYLDAQLVTLASVAEAYHRATVVDTPFAETDHDRSVEAMLSALEDSDASKHYRRRLRHANEFSQAERIQQVIARAGTVIDPLSRKGGRLADRIVATRNVLVHLPVGDEPPLQGLDLAEASRLLVLAMEVNLLLDLDVPPKHAQVLVEHAYNAQAMWGRLVRRGHAWPKGG